MRLVRIGVGAVSVKVGDFTGNLSRLRELVGAARAKGVHLLVMPELCLSGYSLEDRIFWPDITRHSWAALMELAESCTGMTLFSGLPVRFNAMLYNAAALIHDGRVLGLVLKRHLPTYSIFYEMRHWTPWSGGVTQIHGVPAGDLVFRLPFGIIGAEICEDLWSAHSPAWARVAAGAEIICNPSASPFTPRKNEERRRLILGAAASLKAVYAYANVLGCDNSRLVFDGGGMIATPEGIVAEGPTLSWEPWTLTDGVVDLDDVARVRAEHTTWRIGAADRSDAEKTLLVDASEGPFRPAPLASFVQQLPRSFYWQESEAGDGSARDRYLDELFDGLALGLRDYFEKVGAFRRFLVALSGGRDSALCLLLAVKAAKALKGGADAERFAEHVSAVYLPNEAYSSNATRDAARSLAEELGVPFQVVSIGEEAGIALEKAAELAGGADAVTPLARQNLQARVRGNMMLNWANSAGGLLLVTSNLSEAGVGYTTTGGDNEGGYSPINNVPKTLVARLCEYIAERDHIRSLEKVLAIPPSAELAPNQTDESDLMPYIVLDDLLYLYAKRRLSLADCWRIVCLRHPDFEPEQLRRWTADFGRRFALNQWKRDQHPVSLKVLDLDLDPKTGFRFPVTQSIEYELDELKEAKRA
ncbi:MAG: NAD(+) synthase [Candidatus Hydrogenedentes bacterium]|nr:NAD(+) synthase [Candidatus Hydrogenedentota bacterium]